jgi:hypothetical protein
VELEPIVAGRSSWNKRTPFFMRCFYSWQGLGHGLIWVKRLAPSNPAPAKIRPRFKTGHAEQGQGLSGLEHFLSLDTFLLCNLNNLFEHFFYLNFKISGIFLARLCLPLWSFQLFKVSCGERTSICDSSHSHSSSNLRCFFFLTAHLNVFSTVS